jgi:hypothetical protein
MEGNNNNNEETHNFTKIKFKPTAKILAKQNNTASSNNALQDPDILPPTAQDENQQILCEQFIKYLDKDNTASEDTLLQGLQNIKTYPDYPYLELNHVRAVHFALKVASNNQYQTSEVLASEMITEINDECSKENSRYTTEDIYEIKNMTVIGQMVDLANDVS